MQAAMSPHSQLIALRFWLVSVAVTRTMAATRTGLMRFGDESHRNTGQIDPKITERACCITFEQR
jgi:preprotein translocase subunit Sec61beta